MGMITRTPPALANLDAAMSTRAAPASQLSGVIKSVQRGVADMTSVASLDVTVSSVNTAKSVLMHLGLKGAASSDAMKTNAYLQLTTSTNLRLERYAATTGPIVGWQIVEYY